MRLLKNSLYIQKKKLPKLHKNTLITFLLNYKNLILNHVNIENNNNRLLYTIVNQNLIKNTKKYKNLYLLSLLNLTLKKIFFFTLNYKKLIILLSNWLTISTNNINSIIVNKHKIINSNLIYFYIKKKTNYLFQITEKIKYYYITQFGLLLFKHNKKLRFFIENQIDFPNAKKKYIYVILNKIKNLLHNNINITKENKSFFIDYMQLLKLLKKEIIISFFKQSNPIKPQYSFLKNESNEINLNFLNIFLQKTISISLKKAKQIIKQYNLSTLNELIMFHIQKKEPFYVLKENKLIENEKKKWIYLLYMLNNTNDITLKKKILLLITDLNIIKKIFNLKKNNTIIINNKKDVNTFLIQQNQIAHLLNSKNTKNIAYNYNKQMFFIFKKLDNIYKWYKLFTEKKVLITSQKITKRKKKKEWNLFFNKTITHLNKKYGITYNNPLINDNLYYWSSDFNKKPTLQSHLILISEIQKNNYKKIINKYISQQKNNLSYMKSTKNIYLNKIKNIINKETIKNYYITKTNKKLILNIYNDKIYLMDA